MPISEGQKIRNVVVQGWSNLLRTVEQPERLVLSVTQRHVVRPVDIVATTGSLRVGCVDWSMGSLSVGQTEKKEPIGWPRTRYVVAASASAFFALAWIGRCRPLALYHVGQPLVGSFSVTLCDMGGASMSGWDLYVAVGPVQGGSFDSVSVMVTMRCAGESGSQTGTLVVPTPNPSTTMRGDLFDPKDPLDRRRGHRRRCECTPRWRLPRQNRSRW